MSNRPTKTSVPAPISPARAQAWANASPTSRSATRRNGGGSSRLRTPDFPIRERGASGISDPSLSVDLLQYSLGSNRGQVLRHRGDDGMLDEGSAHASGLLLR